jgi:hypothetical protein
MDAEADVACEQALTAQRPTAVIAQHDSRQVREEAPALRAEGREARRRARALWEEGHERGHNRRLPADR